MSNRQSTQPAFLWLPLAVATALVFGFILGGRFYNSHFKLSNDHKLNTILGLISEKYVDTVNIDELIEKSIPDLLSNLDPHTVYLSKEELKAANEELNGSFCGVGISFMIMNDTVNVIEIIPEGPAEKVGVLAGDRIVSINDSAFVGTSVTNNEVMKRLRGEKGSTVKLGIRRNNSNQTLYFNVIRDDIPIKSVDASYMIDKSTGYVKVNQFGRTTYDEFITSLNKLKDEGAKKYMIDLRGNGGGYMEMAVLMVNEFLPDNRLIVYTKGRDKSTFSEFWSDGNGQFQDAEVVVLIDEFSASASEIFAGALQDHDRGLIVGNRSFGKGLVQTQFDLPDKSAIRLTIARYYTPSGRCIQKDYKKGINSYGMEVFDRYSNGELFNIDSIKIDKSKIFATSHGRTVYGGGGIIPDVFVPRDTTGISSYYVEVANAGLIQQYAFNYVDINRNVLKKNTNYKQFLRTEPTSETILNDFVNFAASKGIPARWYYINLSRELIVNYIKALIARDIFGSEAFYPILNRSDKTVEAALKALNHHKAAFPITGK